MVLKQQTIIILKIEPSIDKSTIQNCDDIVERHQTKYYNENIFRSMIIYLTKRLVMLLLELQL